MGYRSHSLGFERLTERVLLISDWCNAALPYDVDGSGAVNPLDALLVINDLNQFGPRLLSSKSTNSPYFDVSNDLYLSPLDLLLVVNAINLKPSDLFVAVSSDATRDLNANAVVLTNQATLRVETSEFSRVRLVNDRWPARFQQPIYIAADGAFSFTVPLERGLNRLAIDVLDPFGRSKVLHLGLQRGDIVTDWNSAILNVVRDWTATSNDPYQGRIVPSRPPEVARNLAMIHAAMFDAINATDGRFESYAYRGPMVTDASPVAAGASAAFEVARALYPAEDELLVWRSTLAESLSIIPDDEARAKGIALGKVVAADLLNLRSTDGSSARVLYQPQDNAGFWRRTYPDYLPPLLPQWPQVTPFVIDEVASYRAPQPPELTSSAYAVAVDEVMRLGALNSSERTADQTEIAVFWADGGGTATPPGHWNRIASDILNHESPSLLDSARTMALLNLAMADAGIVAWDSKYAYNLWRPIDAIRLAGADGNAATMADTNWLPLLRTPPFPTYVSGHSTFSGAAAVVLTELFGDSYAFSSTIDAHSAPGQRPLAESLIVTREFSSFHQAAQEAGMSRIYGGIHFDFDNAQGLAAGERVGAFVVKGALKLRA